MKVVHIENNTVEVRVTGQEARAFMAGSGQGGRAIFDREGVFMHTFSVEDEKEAGFPALLREMQRAAGWEYVSRD